MKTWGPCHEIDPCFHTLHMDSLVVKDGTALHFIGDQIIHSVRVGALYLHHCVPEPGVL